MSRTTGTRWRRLQNLGASQVALVVNTAAALWLTRALIGHLGLADFGITAVASSVALIVGRLGVAFSEATARYVTVSSAGSDTERACGYYSNSVVAVVLASMVGICAIFVVHGLLPKLFGRVPVLYTTAVAGSMALNAVCGVLGVSFFVTERLALRETIGCVTRGLTTVVCVALLAGTTLGIWCLPVAMAAASSLQLGATWYLARKVAPHLRIVVASISSEKAREVAAYVGWMIAVFFATYLVRSGLLLVVERYDTAINVGRIALAAQIGALGLQVLQGLVGVATPGIYRAYARSGVEPASAIAARCSMTVLVAGIAMLAPILLEGDAIIRLWVGESGSSVVAPLATGMVLWAAISSVGSPFGAVLSASNQVARLAVVQLVEAVAILGVIAAGYVGTRHPELWLIAAPSVVCAVRVFVVTPLVFRRRVHLGPAEAWGRTGLLAVGVMLVQLGIGRGLGVALRGDGLGSVATRFGIIGLTALPALVWAWKSVAKVGRQPLAASGETSAAP